VCGLSAMFNGDVSPCILVIVNVSFGRSATLYGDLCVIGRVGRREMLNVWFGVSAMLYGDWLFV
jgi:hypothetical protein